MKKYKKSRFYEDEDFNVDESKKDSKKKSAKDLDMLQELQKEFLCQNTTS